MFLITTGANLLYNKNSLLGVLQLIQARKLLQTFLVISSGNKECCRLKKCTKNEMVGKNAWNFFMVGVAMHYLLYRSPQICPWQNASFQAFQAQKELFVFYLKIAGFWQPVMSRKWITSFTGNSQKQNKW